MLKSHLEGCMEEYSICMKNHWMRVGNFKELRDLKVGSLREYFEKRAMFLAEEFWRERRHLEKSHQDQIENLKQMMGKIGKEEKVKNKIIQDMFQQEKEDIKDKNNDLMELMETEMNSKKVNIYNSLEHLFQKFMKDNKDKYRKFMTLTADNNKDTKKIEETNRRILRVKEKIQLMTLKILQMEKEFNSKNSLIRKENGAIARNFLDLKNKMFEFRNKQHRRLIKLVSNSRRVQKKLSNLKELGERILKTGEFCRKLETREERVIPFIRVGFPQDESSLEHLAGAFEVMELGAECKYLSEEKILKFEVLKNFLEKYNKVLLDKKYLESQNGTLRTQNAFLKQKVVFLLDKKSMPTSYFKSSLNSILSTKKINWSQNSFLTNQVQVLADSQNSVECQPQLVNQKDPLS